jgi:hypothetical protein
MRSCPELDIQRCAQKQAAAVEGGAEGFEQITSAQRGWWTQHWFFSALGTIKKAPL